MKKVKINKTKIFLGMAAILIFSLALAANTQAGASFISGILNINGTINATSIIGVQKLSIVTDFGAISNDGLSDSAAFQAAITHACANNKKVYVPVGTWNVSNINLSCSGIRIDGEGVGSLIDNSAVGATTFYLGTGTAAVTSGGGITNVKIQGRSTEEGSAYDTGDAIRLINVNSFEIRNVYIHRSGTKGISIYANGTGKYASNILMDNVLIDDCEVAGIYAENVDGGVDNWITLLKLSNSWINKNGINIWMMKGANTAQMGASLFSNNYLEVDNGEINIQLNGSSTNQFNNIILDGNAGEENIILSNTPGNSAWNTFTNIDVVTGNFNIGTGSMNNYAFTNGVKGVGFTGSSLLINGRIRQGGANNDNVGVALDLRNATNIRMPTSYGAIRNDTYLYLGGYNDVNNNGVAKGYAFDVRYNSESQQAKFVIKEYSGYNATDPSGLSKIDDDITKYTEVFSITNKKVGINTTSPAITLDVNADSIRIRSNITNWTARTCSTGEIAWNITKIAVCVSTNTWKMATLS